MKNYAIILAGGVGSRFWPLSRASLPKQFLRIIGKDTSLQSTIKRLRSIIPDANIFIATQRSYLYGIKKQIREFAIPRENIILEPKPLNTLPAISLCAQMIYLKNRQANLLVLPADHYIRGGAGFKKTVLKALHYSEKGFISLIGVRASTACSGYGYIKKGLQLAPGVSKVSAFIEKPALDAMKRLFKEKEIFWNSGIFCFQAGVILRETKAYAPALFRQLTRIRRKQDIIKVWPAIKPNSIDYAILEKSRNLVMVEAGFYWRDLGSWDTLCEVLPKDKQKNIILSDCVNLNCNNILVSSYSGGRLIAAVGLEDIIIVDTKDALLVAKKESSQDIKLLVALLNKKRKKCV